MLTENNLILLYSLPVYQLLFYTVQLVSFKKPNPARKYLGLLFATMTIFLIINALFNLGYDYTLLLYFLLPLLLLLLPLKFLYLLSLFQKRSQLNGPKTFILFLPTILVLAAELLGLGLIVVLQQALFAGNSNVLSYQYDTESAVLINAVFASFIILIITQIAFSVFRVADLLITEKSELQQNPKQSAHINYRWIIIVSAGLLIFIIASTIEIFIFRSTDIIRAGIFNILVLFAGGITGYYAMKQDALMQEVYGVGSIISLSTAENTEYTDAKPDLNLSAEKIAEIIQKIETLMENEKPFLQKDYGVTDLSRQTSEKRIHLTRIINDRMGANFIGLINDYRIREAIRMLKYNTHNYTIDAIADMAGFQSRSTFYVCFKKFTGVTPKEYLRKQSNEET